MRKAYIMEQEKKNEFRPYEDREEHEFTNKFSAEYARALHHINKMGELMTNYILRAKLKRRKEDEPIH